MSGLTPKGEFALKLSQEGKKFTLKELDVLWAEHTQKPETAKATKTCPTCHGLGRVLR